MEYLGYRKTGKDAYKGSLYLEALLEEATGNLRAVNYVYRNSLDGFTDNGQITFSDWNIPVNTDPLAQTQPDSTVPGASQPITTPSSSGSSTGSAATKGVSTSSPASASTNP